MRIAVVSSTSKRFGGAETYLEAVIPALAEAGHALAYLCEVALPVDRATLPIPSDAPVWCVAGSSPGRPLAELKAWSPDAICVHGLHDPQLEEALIAVAPVVFFAHDYYGLCISGNKSFSWPQMRPCGCRFDWRCLARFYPRRCGGLNPMTTWRLYRASAQRLELLHRYDAIVVASAALRRAMLDQDLDPARVHLIVPPLPRSTASQLGAIAQDSDRAPSRLLWAGRMVELKGGALLLQALPAAAAQLGRPLHLTMAGDGPARSSWERLACRVMSRDRGITVEFTGWLEAAASTDVFARSDLHVMPSCWPEPFGRAGIEACRAGLPSVAFAVGGIPDWLTDGVNGHLVPGDPPSAAGLSEAIVQSLRDPTHFQTLRDGAIVAARRFDLDRHVGQLIALFDNLRAVARGRSQGAMDPACRSL